MKQPDIIFIINSYNRINLLKDGVNSIISWYPHSVLNNRLGIIIYDAGSTDGSLEWLEERTRHLDIPLNILIAKAGEDSSFAAGLNAGVQHAHDLFPNLQYLLFYETDNQILSDTPILQALSQLNNRKDLAACGFTVCLTSGSPAGVGMPFPKLLNFLLGKNLVHRFQLEAVPYHWEGDKYGVEFSTVDVVFTSPLLVKIEAWNESSGLDAVTFPFSDCDVDWARRLSKLGWHMGVIRTNDVIHDNTGALSSWSKNRAIQFHRARLKYFKRYHPISIYAVWPVLLSVRHIAEIFSVKLAEKDPIRRTQLANQFINLLKTCIKHYE